MSDRDDNPSRPTARQEIFVFGSNLAGRHGKGAALHARKFYGAEYGVGEGMTGRSYALPTKDESLKTMPISKIRENIVRFLETARDRTDCIFLLTPVGTGLAGHYKAEIWLILRDAGVPKNVVLTSSWVTD